jgi:cobalt-zinc-cadmium efflux system outer membrane protein
MRNASNLLTPVVLFWCAAFVARAEGAGALAPASVRRTLTLAEAKMMSFEHNWDLLAARSDVDNATAQRIVAREFPNPILSLSTTKISADSHASSADGRNGFWGRSYDTVVAVNQLFEVGGKRSQRKASAAAGFKAAEGRLNDARRVLDLAVTKAYVGALLAETNVNILKRSAASLRKEAEIAETRLNAGDISRADKSQIEIAADRLELDAAAATASAATARIAVDVLLGLPKPAGDWAPGDSLETLALPPFLASERMPGAFRPDLLAAEAGLQKAEADLKLQKALRIPDPTFLVQYEHEPPEEPNTLGIGLSFPLPLWNRNKGGIQAASAGLNQAAVQVEKVKALIAAEIATAEVAYSDASARWRRQRDFIVPKSAEIRQTITFAYEKGGASLLDLLLAERNDNEVRLATVQAAADTATAAAALKAALNLPDQPKAPTPTPK